ncbi:dTDP-4-dehydrorhamnose reductase [Mycobacterium sp. MS1601]|uniref:dTDP-4-dehydrorhamnose reductase n=1 Tax=Mycobacterium sp. MS1601 TaxID=1936029 RepID=UPI0009794F4D|nr:dTDP-4-dehydrorhamnose reductase [Mycobacterium sp. MS1601]AQA01460.1 dTDP-4-dehydrorhamnose reductase [Mycobacterium sp. MS1601]
MADTGPNLPRIVITGAGGQVGGFLARLVEQRGHRVAAYTSAQWDITDPQAAEALIEDGDAVVNCAAFTAVDAAENQQDRAYAVNVTGAENVAQACARVGAQLIHISTDYVFSGHFSGRPRPYEPGDETGPHSVYGSTKLAGELAVLAALPDTTVVRTAWVFTGGTGSDFAAVMRAKAAAGEGVDVVADQIGSPTYVGDLCAALLEIAGGTIRESVLHAANSEPASRFELARAVYENVGADPELVRPVGTESHPRPAPRPPFSALGGELSARAGLTPLRPWRQALAEALITNVGPLPSTP